jgi:hypothetical protein
MSRYYSTHITDAPWCRCKTCGGQAAFGIDVHPNRTGSQRGKRSVGTYCREHGEAKLEELRKKAAR